MRTVRADNRYQRSDNPQRVSQRSSVSRTRPSVGEVALEIGPATLFVGAVTGLVAEVNQCLDPPVPETVWLGEAVGVVGAEADIEAEEGAEGIGLVVTEVGAGQVAVEVGREDLGVRVCAEAGEGEPVAAARVADLAVQEQAADVLAERSAPADADQPGGGQARTPLEAQERRQLGIGDRGRVADQPASPSSCWTSLSMRGVMRRVGRGARRREATSRAPRGPPATAPSPPLPRPRRSPA